MKQNIVKHNQKGIAPIVIILIIVGVLVVAGGVYYFFQKKNEAGCIQVIVPARNQKTGECKIFPTPCDMPSSGWVQDDTCKTKDETADWKTYRNEEYGFEFKYPKEFNLVGSDRSLSGEYSFLEDQLIAVNQEKSFPEYNLNTEYVFSANRSLKDSALDKCFISIENQKPLTNPKIVKIGENDVVFSFQNYGGVAAGSHYDRNIYRAVTNLGCFEIALSVRTSSDWNIQGTVQKSENEVSNGFTLLDKILSTFKFIE